MVKDDYTITRICIVTAIDKLKDAMLEKNDDEVKVLLEELRDEYEYYCSLDIKDYY